MHLILAFVIYTITWKTGVSLTSDDPNVCTKYILRSDGFSIRRELTTECCPNYFLEDDRCKECPAGTFGKDCTLHCLPGYYGFGCKYPCDCNVNAHCNSSIGCVCNAGFTGPGCTKGSNRSKCPLHTEGNCTGQDDWDFSNSNPLTTKTDFINGTEIALHDKELVFRNAQLILMIAVPACLVTLFASSICIFICIKRHGKPQVTSRQMTPSDHHYDEIYPYNEIPQDHINVDIPPDEATNVNQVHLHRRWSFPTLFTYEEPVPHSSKNAQVNQNREQANLKPSHILQGYDLARMHKISCKYDDAYLNPYQRLQDYDSGRIYNKLTTNKRSQSCGYICMHKYAVIKKTIESRISQ